MLRIIAIFLLVLVAVPLLPQDCEISTRVARPRPRHFTEPELGLQVEAGASRPIFIVTNVYQEPLTGFVVEVREDGKVLDTFIANADKRVVLVSRIPRGLSVVLGIPRVVGKPAPTDLRVVAAVWADGSTYGPEDRLKEIDAAGPLR